MKTKLNEFKTFLRKEIKAALSEVESKYADSFELDQAKGGADSSMDKVQKTLLKLQKEMDKLFADFKAGKLDAKSYAMKRKPLQAQRNKLEADLLSIEEARVRTAVRGIIGKLFEAEKKDEPKQEDNDLETISAQVTTWYDSNKKKLEKLADEEDWDSFYEMGFDKFPEADQDDVAQAMNKAAMSSGLFEAEEVAEMPTEKELEDMAFGDKKLQKGVKMGDYDKKNKMPKASPTELKPEELKKLKTESKKKDDEVIEEAEYRGRKVKLNKPFYTPGGPRKRAVYVTNDKGNVVKVGFGDPNMRIKKHLPGHRKSYRARHHCENPGPRWKANYWSCRMW